MEDDVAPVLSSIDRRLAAPRDADLDDLGRPVGLGGAVLAAGDPTVASTPLNLQFVAGQRVVFSGLRRGTTYGYRRLSAERGNRGSSAIRYLAVR